MTANPNPTIPTAAHDSVSKRFHARVDRSGECWVWTGRLDSDGYGALTVYDPDTGRERDGKAHRIAYALATGQDPGAFCICHTCDNRRCVRPDHLFLGTNAENTADRNRKDRQAKGSRMAAAKLSESQVMEIRALLAAGEKQVAIAARFGVSQSLISQIKVGIGWRHAC